MVMGMQFVPAMSGAGHSSGLVVQRERALMRESTGSVNLLG